MVKVIVEHHIKNWAKFEEIMLDDGLRRGYLGSKGGTIYRNVNDPKNIWMVFDWDDAERAKSFANGLGTHELMKWASSGIESTTVVLEEISTVKE